jgi:hypothetical protein
MKRIEVIIIGTFIASGALSGVALLSSTKIHSEPPARVAFQQQDPVEVGTGSSTVADIEQEPTFPEMPTAIVPSATTGERPPQFVLLAFDGSRSLDFWKQSRAFAKEMTARGKSLHFTYFISGVYFLDQKHQELYQPPGHPLKRSLIGWGYGPKEIADRIEQVNLAAAEGNDIESHANGHFSGSTWTHDEWRQEFDAFASITSHVTENNDLQNETPNRRGFILPHPFNGFRAPELGTDDAMWTVLNEQGFRWDVSRVGKPDAWPVKYHGLWEFPLAKIHFATTTSNILSMDYNFYLKQTGAKDTVKKGDPSWQELHDQMMMSYTNYFNSNYSGTRAPVSIGHHFSEWNDGVYWQTMKDFADQVCGLPDVRCITYTELADWLDSHSTHP